MLVSLDGVGAFDHVCRARFFEELCRVPELHDLIPFVSLWYGDISRYFWQDGNKKMNLIKQDLAKYAYSDKRKIEFCTLRKLCEKLRASVL